MLVATVILGAACLSIGYYIGSRFPTSPASQTSQPKGPRNSEQVNNECEEEEDVYDGDLGAVVASGPCKLVLVVRTDLDMSPGKISAQYVLSVWLKYLE